MGDTSSHLPNGHISLSGHECLLMLSDLGQELRQTGASRAAPCWGPGYAAAVCHDPAYLLLAIREHYFSCNLIPGLVYPSPSSPCPLQECLSSFSCPGTATFHRARLGSVSLESRHCCVGSGIGVLLDRTFLSSSRLVLNCSGKEHSY